MVDYDAMREGNDVDRHLAKATHATYLAMVALQCDARMMQRDATRAKAKAKKAASAWRRLITLRDAD